jgi:NDP-sugar pyrophosphorylase family protein
MKSILICPSEQPAVPFLGTKEPLCNIPMLGQGLLEYWLSFLACARVKDVLVLAQDQTDKVEALVGDGARWGLKVEVAANSRELTPEEALAQYGPDCAVTVLDHFPELPDKPLFTSYRDWFAAVLAWMPRARTSNRAGVREVKPGIWIGLHGNLSCEAELRAPCWLGDHVYVGPGAVIGPGSILETGAFVEPEAEVVDSFVGPDTFIGRYVQIKDSLAWGDTLINWKTSLEIKVPDAFLLCSLRKQHPKQRSARWLDRIAGLWTNLGEAEPVLREPLLVKRQS